MSPLKPNTHSGPQAKPLDCLVIGGGPAGLTAATYLARFRRRVAVLHTGDSRAKWIPKIRNCPGFPDGISGPDLLERLRLQATEYGAEIVETPVTGLHKNGDGFVAATPAGEINAHTVLLATGVLDTLPALPDVAERIASGHVRLCPVCDGYEVIDSRVGVLGHTQHSAKEARFLLNYTRNVSLIPLGATVSDEVRNECTKAGITLFEGCADILTERDGYRVLLTTGDYASFDVLYPAMGCQVRSELGSPLGLALDENRQIITDAHQRTNIEGIYAAGDVVHALNQIAVAFGQAAMAATDIHNRLFETDR